MTGIGENTLAQPVKPPLRERCACLAKLVKNRLTLTDADGARLLFQVLADAYERQSVVFTTNLEFSRCGRCSGTTRWPPP